MSTVLLLDGLNELPVSQRKDKYQQTQTLIQNNKQLLAVMSCRELDYTIDLKFDTINILPLDPIRIREFVRRDLGEEKGEELFWKLAGEETQKTYQEFLQKFSDKLDDPENTFWIEPQLPKGMYWGYSWRDEKNDNSYWENWLKLRETPSSLMLMARNPYLLSMLNAEFAEAGKVPDNRGDLFRAFVDRLLKRERDSIQDENQREALRNEQETLINALAQLAFKMQNQRSESDEGSALTALSKTEALDTLSERQLYLAGCASILNVSDPVRFSHQLLQEYFAAKYMDIEFQAGRLQAKKLWSRESWWERNNWEEAAILLAGLYSDDCTPIVKWLADANPEVAAQCIVRSGSNIAPSTLEQLRQQWIPRLTDLKRDPDAKARAAVGRALGITGLDNRKGVGVENGLPDIDWVEIPGGDFQYGSEEEYSAKPEIISPSTFRISRYPITAVQFQAFLDDPEGYINERWLEGLAVHEGDPQMHEQYFKYDNHPRETVNWYQAMAFCRWLSWRMGSGYDLKKIDEWKVRLPTEFEWEKAARGTDGRLYPYKGDYDPAKANTHDTGIRQTSAVGIFPNGASPDGAMDMSGNVWEWCLSNRDKPAREAQKENLRNENSRVLRGGSWSLIQGSSCAVYRFSRDPASRNSPIGFRLCCAVRPTS